MRPDSICTYSSDADTRASVWTLCAVTGCVAEHSFKRMWSRSLKYKLMPGTTAERESDHPKSARQQHYSSAAPYERRRLAPSVRRVNQIPGPLNGSAPTRPFAAQWRNEQKVSKLRADNENGPPVGKPLTGGRGICRASRGDARSHHTLIPISLVSRYSPIPSAEPSRPSPLSFTPPKGAAAEVGLMSLIPTIPNRSCSATRIAREISRV